MISWTNFVRSPSNRGDGEKVSREGELVVGQHREERVENTPNSS